MATYYRINLKDKNGNIIYPNIHPNWQFNDTTGNVTAAEKEIKLNNFATTAIIATDKRESLTPSDLTGSRIQSFFSTLGAFDSQTDNGDWVEALTLNSWKNTSGGEVNALVFTKKATQGIYHYVGTYGENTWTAKKKIAYTDSDITGNAATATKATNDSDGNKISDTYLKLSGGTMTGGIKIAKEINSSSNGDIPYANSDLVLDDITNLKNYKTYMGALQWGTGNWKAILSVRHRNGSEDGPDYGFYFMTDLTKIGSLIWRKQVGETTWDSERTLLDSVNYSNYSLPLGGGSMTGPLTFANNTWNLMGDDCYIGDRNIEGTICLKGKTGEATAVRFYGNNNEGNWGDITYNGSFNFSVPFAGLTHNTLGVTIENTTTNNGWSMIAGNYYGYILRSVRTNQYAPSWIIGDYSAGICFGGSDTKGVISCAYPEPRIRFAGGNSTAPKWWCQLTGTNETNITLPSFSTRVVGTEDGGVLSLRANSLSTWDSNNSSYRNGTIMFCW